VTASAAAPRSCRRRAALVVLAAVLTIAGTPRPWQDIHRRGWVSVCAPPNALPFGSRNGPVRGLRVDLAQAIADRLGVELRVEWVTESVQRRRVGCDLVVDVFLDYHALKDARVIPTVPYQHTGVALALGPGLEGIIRLDDVPRETRIGVLVGSLAQTLLGKRGYAVIPFGFEQDMLQAVTSGEVAAAAATPASIGWYNREHADRPLAIAHIYDHEPELAWDLAIGMRRSERGFRREVNDIVKAMVEDGTVTRILAAYGIEHRRPGV
jgi:polar amino acid transport system substrate-binding protein